MSTYLLSTSLSATEALAHWPCQWWWGRIPHTRGLIDSVQGDSAGDCSVVCRWAGCHAISLQSWLTQPLSCSQPWSRPVHGHIMGKKVQFDPGAVLDRVISSAEPEDECFLYKLADFKKSGQLVDAFNNSGSKVCHSSQIIQHNIHTDSFTKTMKSWLKQIYNLM